MAEPDYRAYAAAGAGALQQWYRPWRGLWATTGWWNSANALTAVIGYTQCTGDNTYAGVIERSFKRARRRHQGFTNSYYDDNAWWALAWVAAILCAGFAARRLGGITGDVLGAVVELAELAALLAGAALIGRGLL